MGRKDGRHILIAVARYLAAHSPTERAQLQTAMVARRLSRGESIHEALDEEEPQSVSPAGKSREHQPCSSGSKLVRELIKNGLTNIPRVFPSSARVAEVRWACLPAFLCREAILRAQQEAQERRGPDPGL